MRLLIRFLALVLILGFSLSSSAEAQEKAPVSESKNSETLIKGIGSLKIRPATKGKGSIAIFSRVRPLTHYCSGACDGVSVGEWQCSDDYSCALDCTMTPPRKYCLKL